VQYLAAAGVGRITLVDGDRVQRSNLQRQILFSDADVGQLKAEVTAERLRQLNPDIRIVNLDVYLDRALAEELIPEHDIVVDGTDNFAAKFVINDICVKHSRPFVYGAISGVDGELATFWSGQGACYRCFRGSQPQHHVPNCAEAGVIGAVAGLVGSAQALEVIRHLVSRTSPGHILTPQYGELRKLGLFYGGGAWQIEKDKKCLACSEHADVDKLDYAVGVTCSSVSLLTDRTHSLELSEINPTDYLIDVREFDEWQVGHIPGAVHWPLSKMLSGDFPDIAQVKSRIVLYCKSGARSSQARDLIGRVKNKTVLSLSGGLSNYYSDAHPGPN
jgi:adenylyltransferase/sulfurtransferase